MDIIGIHHITALTSNAQRNYEFYKGVLGLRLVKQTVNFDDPTTSHLYYGDNSGTPGTLLTFFVYDTVMPGYAGAGMITALSLKVPKGSLEFWDSHLTDNEVEHLGILSHLDEDHITLDDPDGILVRLVESDDITDTSYYENGDIPPEFAIKGIHGIRIATNQINKTEQLITETFHMTKEADEHGITKYSLGHFKAYLQSTDHIKEGQHGTGTIHHVAWQVADAAAQNRVRDQLQRQLLRPTPIIDRTYFSSVYFTEPGGSLFEIATNDPGFSVDEPLDKLGTSLVLPAALEPRRAEIVTSLQPLVL